MFERILVAVDGSESALSAVEYGVELQKRFDAELMLLCVYKHYSMLDASLLVGPSAEQEPPDAALREHATGVVENAKQFAAEQGAKDVRGFVKIGAPARTIVNFAKDKHAGLIVLGSRGLGDVEGFLLGSVSHKVTSLSHCPTLIV